MSKEMYFRQFRGDLMRVEAFFLFFNGEAMLGTTDKELADKKLVEMTHRFPELNWEIKIGELPEEYPMVEYASLSS